MYRAYKQDGSYVEYGDDQVQVITITGDNLLKMENYKNGVTLYFRDGTTHFVENAKTDGNYIELYYEKK